MSNHKWDDQRDWLLRQADLIASRPESASKDVVEVYDVDDGKYQFTVRPDIHYEDLVALIRYGKHMLQVGIKLGEERMQAGLRQLIGAAAAEHRHDN